MIKLEVRKTPLALGTAQGSTIGGALLILSMPFMPGWSEFFIAGVFGTIFTSLGLYGWGEINEYQLKFSEDADDL